MPGSIIASSSTIRVGADEEVLVDGGRVQEEEDRIGPRRRVAGRQVDVEVARAAEDRREIRRSSPWLWVWSSTRPGEPTVEPVEAGDARELPPRGGATARRIRTAAASRMRISTRCT